MYKRRISILLLFGVSGPDSRGLLVLGATQQTRFFIYSRGVRDRASGDNSFVDAVTTVSANLTTKNVKVIEVSNRGTLGMTSDVFGAMRNVRLGGLDNCGTTFKQMFFSKGPVSRTITLMFETPGDCANRSIIRVSYRNNLCVAGRILETTLGGNTIPTRPKRFAGHTFLGKGASLAGTRTIVNVVSTRNGRTNRTTFSTLRNTLCGRVRGVASILLGVGTTLTT